MSKTTYIRIPDRITSAELRQQFITDFKPYDPDREFPRWIWPYIRNAVKAGKLRIDLRSKKFTVPKNADINDYSLPVIGFMKKAGLSFSGIELTKLPDDYFTVLSEAISSKVMDQYGKVDPENLHRIPWPLIPYVRVTGRLGKILAEVGKVDPENPRDFPPKLWPYI